jgi:hypothetical protein
MPSVLSAYCTPGILFVSSRGGFMKLLCRSIRGWYKMARSCYARSIRALADTSLFIHFHPQLFHIQESAKSLAWQPF